MVLVKECYFLFEYVVTLSFNYMIRYNIDYYLIIKYSMLNAFTIYSIFMVRILLYHNIFMNFFKPYNSVIFLRNILEGRKHFYGD